MNGQQAPPGVQSSRLVPCQVALNKVQSSAGGTIRYST